MTDSSHLEMPSNGISNQEVEVYDRQLRLWGLETQQKIGAARILIIEMSSINVEAIKNLALAGFSLHLMDSSIISTHHLDYNFLFRPSDLNKKTAEVTMQRVKEMNPLITLTWTNNSFLDIYECDEATLLTYIQTFTAICISAETYPLPTLAKLDKLCKQAHVALFASLCCGKFGFIFLDLHLHHVKQLSGVSQNKGSEKDGVKHKNEEMCIQYPSLEETLSIRMSNFGPKINPLFYGFFALFRWEASFISTLKTKEISTQKSLSGYESLDFVSFARQTFISEQVTPDREYLSDSLLGDLWRFYRCQFAPTAAILGGLLAQEVRKFVSHQHIPLPNCLLFDMETSSSSVAQIP